MSCPKCGSCRSQGKEGEKGSWCSECGHKVFEVDDRECKDCKHFFNSPGYTGCRKHLMSVIPTMNVTYEIENGSCFEPN